jgi:CNT family concentrative nucleoside transporter
MTALQAQSGFGLLALCVLAWALGGFKRGVSARVVLMGLALQIVLGAALLHIAPLRAGFSYLGDAVNALAVATQAGTSTAPPRICVMMPKGKVVASITGAKSSSL